jgi:membrane protein
MPRWHGPGLGRPTGVRARAAPDRVGSPWVVHEVSPLAAGVLADGGGRVLRREGRRLAMRLKERIVAERIKVMAAGVAFYALLASMPALTAMVSIYGLVLDPQHISDQLRDLSSLLPPQAAELLMDPIQDLVDADHGSLGIGFAVSLVLVLWASSTGMRALMIAMNAAYGVRESRGVLRIIGMSLLFSGGAILVVLLAMVAIVVLPAASEVLGLGGALHSVFMWLRWPIIALAFWLGLVLLYRYGPDRETQARSWANWGALTAVLLWLGGSWAFSVYVGNFGRFNTTYGSMGAVVVLHLWFLLSAWAVLIGAVLNAVRQEGLSRAPRSP